MSLTVFKFSGGLPDTTSSDVTLTNSSFSNASQLTEVIVGTIVQFIGDYCFSGLPQPMYVSFDSPSNVRIIGTEAFSYGQLTSIVLPPSVTLLGTAAFAAISSLTSISLGTNSALTAIPFRCFLQCTNLESVILPANITTMASEAFRLCSSKLTLAFVNQNTFTTAAINVFLSTPAIKVTYFNTASAANLSAGSVNLRNQMAAGSTFTFDSNPPAPTTFKYIGFPNTTSSDVTLTTSSYTNASSLTEVNVGNTVLTFDAACFADLAGLSIVSFISNPLITTFENNALRGTGITEITLPETVTRIGSNVFEDTFSLTSMSFLKQSTLSSVGTNNFLTNTVPLDVTYYQTSSALNLSTASQTLQSQMPAGSTFTYDPNPVCFHRGTGILCLVDGQEVLVAVENLVVGETEVKTFLHGYRKVKLLHHSKMFTNLDHFNKRIFVMRKSDTNGLSDDLLVTGGHGMLVDTIDDPAVAQLNLERYKGVQPAIDGKLLLLAGVSPAFEPLEATQFQAFDVYNFCLENDGDDDRRYGVYANGLLMETPSINQINSFEF